MTIANQIPTGAAAIPMLECLATAGRVIECHAFDYRADTTTPLYLMLFDTNEVPSDGDAPMIPALEVCKSSGWEFVSNDAPFSVSSGLWIALSSTPLELTKLAANQDFALTARVYP